LDAPDRPSMAILLDSPAWAARRTAGDRDGLPGDVLTRMMRWPSVQRVWLPAWIRDRDAVLDKLEMAFAEAASGLSAPVLNSSIGELPSGLPPVAFSTAGSVFGHVPAAAPVPLLASAAGGSRIATAVVEPESPAYKPWTIRRFGSIDVLDSLPSRRAAASVREAIRAIVEAEGPVHQERLAKLTCAAFGLNKVNPQRSNSVLDVLDTSVHRCDEDGFIWDASIDREEWSEFRTTGQDVDRKPEHISVVELRNAMVEIVRLSGGISVSELHRETIRVFGGKRRTVGITARLNEGLQYGVDSERLELRGDVVHLFG
ncbi:protein involved in mismatch repair, partial [Arthrobacter sp. Hiyo6]